jgi:hypothetical protein
MSLDDPKLDLGIKMGPGRPKNQSSQNGFKTDMCVGLVDTNPTQIEQAQTNIVRERYRGLFISPNMQKNVDCIVCTMLTWKLTVQVVQSYNWPGMVHWHWHGHVKMWMSQIMTHGTTTRVTRGKYNWHELTWHRLTWQWVGRLLTGHDSW